MDYNETELNGYKEIVFSVEERCLQSLKIRKRRAPRAACIPVTETGGRIHTSAVTVAVLPEVDEVDYEIDRKIFKLTPIVPQAQGANTSTRRAQR